MRGAAWMPTQELRHGREPLPEHPPPHDERGGTGPLPWIQALRPTAQALGNAPRRPALRAKGLLRCYHRGSGSNHGKNLMANACSDGRRCSPLCRDEGDGQHSAWAWGQGVGTGLCLNGLLPGAIRLLGSRAMACCTRTGRTLACTHHSKSLASLWLSRSISSGEKLFPRSLKGIKRREVGVRTDPRSAFQRKLLLSEAMPGWPAPPAQLQVPWERRRCWLCSTAAGVARESPCAMK